MSTKKLLGIKVDPEFDDKLNETVTLLRTQHGFKLNKSDLVRLLLEYRMSNAVAIWLEQKTDLFHVKHQIPWNKQKRRRGRI